MKKLFRPLANNAWHSRVYELLFFLLFFLAFFLHVLVFFFLLHRQTCFKISLTNIQCYSEQRGFNYTRWDMHIDCKPQWFVHMPFIVWDILTNITFLFVSIVYKTRVISNSFRWMTIFPWCNIQYEIKICPDLITSCTMRNCRIFLN